MSLVHYLEGKQQLITFTIQPTPEAPIESQIETESEENFDDFDGGIEL